MRGLLADYRAHIIVGTLLLLFVVLPLLWFALAYGGLPRLWSHHERRKGRPDGDAVSYTAQGIPADPINLKVLGSEDRIKCALNQAGWTKADSVSLQSAIGIAKSVILARPYAAAPVSPLFFEDQQQAVAFQLDEGVSAARRHHVRFWRTDRDLWYGSATFDRGVGLSLFTLQITHHIGPAVDAERNRVASALAQGSAQALAASLRPTKHLRRNGGGDRYVTDGRVAVVVMNPKSTLCYHPD